MEGRQGRNLRQELESETNERMLLSGLLPGSPVATFLTGPMQICLGKIPPTVGRALLHQINNQKNASQMGPRANLMEAILQLTIPLPGCVRLTKED